MNLIPLKSSLLLTIIMSILFSACSPQKTGTEDHIFNIKIAVLPILDTLPIYVADEEGLFQKHNINVEFIPAGSAPKRDELINSGQVDGMINEVVSTIFYNRDETQVQIVRYARIATPDSPIFRILTSNKSGITNISQLKGVPIGVSKGTVIEYLTDRILQAEGFTQNEIEVISIPDIGQRMALLASGQVDAAMLPDPLASLVLDQGANLLIEDSSHPEYSHSVYTFRKQFIDQNPEAIKGFLAAIEEAIEKINVNPQQFSDTLIERELVPEPLAEKYEVPSFVTAGIPSLTQWDDVVEWIRSKGLEVGKADYYTSITSEFLP